MYEQEYSTAQIEGSPPEQRAHPEGVGQPCGHLGGDCAPVGKLKEGQLPTYVAEVSQGARGDARAASARSPPRVSGAAA
jgi:hypothetical protein